MIILIVALSSLFVCFAAGAGQIRHLQLNNADLIETTSSNYGLSAPILLQNNWKTVSVNGDNVIFFGPGCQKSVRPSGTLLPAERSLIENVKQQFSSVETGNPQMLGTRANKSGLATYSLQQETGQSASNSYSRNMNVFSFNSNGYSVTRYEENNFSISRPNLPDNTNRVFLDGDVVTFVYNDGQILMKPARCLSDMEGQLIAKLKIEVQQAEQQFQLNMQQMNQNMANMQQNLQQNMQNMQMRMQQNMQNLHQNLNGMFNGFGAAGQQFPNMANNLITPGFRPQINQGYQQQSQYSDPSFYGGSFGLPRQQINAYTGTGGYASPYTSGNFPFGPNNSPFGSGFPFSR